MENLVKSNTELHTYWLLKEFKDRGIVLDFKYEEKSFVLSKSIIVDTLIKDKNDKIKKKKRVLMQGHLYTPDFEIEWNPDYIGVIFSDLNLIEITPFFIASKNEEGKYITYLEVKPEFDFNNMTRLFTNTKKWVYQKYKVYIQLFNPEQFFIKHFIPLRYLKTDKESKDRKINFMYLTYNQWIKIIHKPKNLNQNEPII